VRLKRMCVGVVFGLVLCSPVAAAPAGAESGVPIANLKDQGLNQFEAPYADKLIAAYTSPEWRDVIDMVMTYRNGAYEVWGGSGHIRFVRQRQGGGWSYRIVEQLGTNPIADQRVDRLATSAEETALPIPTAAQNTWPNAYERIVGLFDHPRAPDLAIVRNTANYDGSELGNHGSLGAYQSRAILLAAGAGVKKLGIINKSARVVDVAPTALNLLGTATREGKTLNGSTATGLYLARQDGKVLADILDGTTAEYVLINLWDGAQPTVLMDLVAKGELPTIKSLLDDGTMYGYGSISVFPSVTLANHPSTVFGSYNGHHGSISNSFYERETKTLVAINSINEWYRTANYLEKDNETVFEAVHRSFGDWRGPDNTDPLAEGAYTVATNEPADRGADFSTFQYLRTSLQPGNPADIPPDALDPTYLPCWDPAIALSYPDSYGLESQLDDISARAVMQAWNTAGVTHPAPKLVFMNFTQPDGTSHVVGPRGPEALRAYRDNDCRLRQVLAKIPAEARAKMAIFFVSDHGMGPMDKSNPRNTDDVLAKERIQAVEDGGFIYLLNLRAQLTSGTPTKGAASTLVYTVTDDDTGKPVSGAEATLTSGEQRLEGTTDADGKVTFSITPSANELVFEASDSGFNAARLTHDLSSAKGARTPGTGSPASLVLAGLAALVSSAGMRRARARIQHRNTR